MMLDVIRIVIESYGVMGHVVVFVKIFIGKILSNLHVLIFGRLVLIIYSLRSSSVFTIIVLLVCLMYKIDVAIKIT